MGFYKNQHAYIKYLILYEINCEINGINVVISDLLQVELLSLSQIGLGIISRNTLIFSKHSALYLMQHPKPFSSANSTIKQLINFYWQTQQNKSQIRKAETESKGKREERGERGKTRISLQFFSKQINRVSKTQIILQGHVRLPPPGERGTVHCVCLGSDLPENGNDRNRQSRQSGITYRRTHAQAAGKDREETRQIL